MGREKAQACGNRHSSSEDRNVKGQGRNSILPGKGQGRQIFLRWEDKKTQHYLYVDGKELVVKEKLNDAGDGSQVFN